MTWHVATTRSGKEASATDDLNTIGIEAYYPQKARWKQTQRGKHRVTMPMLPGYVFFRLNDPDEQRYLDTCDGVTGVLTAGFAPNGDRKLARIPTEWVEGIREDERKGEFDSTIDRRRKAKPGDMVRIVTGSFNNHLASIRRAANKREWDVVIEDAGQMKGHKVTIAMEGVETLEEAA